MPDNPAGGDACRKEDLHGVHRPLADWLNVNRNVPYEADALEHIAPFPPAELMQVVSGLTNPEHFALHGVAILEALATTSPKPQTNYQSILDFGCGCGHQTHKNKRYQCKHVGCDIDARLVDWVNQH